MDRICATVSGVFHVAAIKVWPVPLCVRVRDRCTGRNAGSARCLAHQGMEWK